MRPGNGRTSFKKSLSLPLARTISTFVDTRSTGQVSREVPKALARGAGSAISNICPSSFVTPSISFRNRWAKASPNSCTPKVGIFLGELAENVARIAKYVEDEVVLESGLHVAGMDAGSCYEKFGLPSEVAPSLIGAPDSVEYSSLLDSDTTMELAMCLATPSEGPNDRGWEEEIRRSLNEVEQSTELQQEIEGAMGSLEELELFEPGREEQRVVSEHRAFWRRRLADSGDGEDDTIQWMQYSGAEAK